MLNLIDEFTRERLAIRVDRKLKYTDVIDLLPDQFILRGVRATFARTTPPPASTVTSKPTMHQDWPRTTR